MQAPIRILLIAPCWKQLFGNQRSTHQSGTIEAILRQQIWL